MAKTEKIYTEKACTYCHETKRIELFPKCSRSGDGKASCCKECFAIRYGKKYNERRKSEEARARTRERRRQHRAKGLEVVKERDKRSAKAARERHPQKCAARQALKNAIERGDVVRQTTCEECGNVDPRAIDGRSLVQAHHDDYSKPLAVRWLCSLCHAKHHMAMKEGR